MQPAVAIQQPPFVDQQRGVDLAGVERVEDARERDDRDLDRDRRRLDQAQHQPGGGGDAGDPDARPRQLGWLHRAPRHHDRPEAPPHGGAMGQQLVAPRDPRIDPGRDGDDVGDDVGSAATPCPLAADGAGSPSANRLSAAVSPRQCVNEKPPVSISPARMAWNMNASSASAE